MAEPTTWALVLLEAAAAILAWLTHSRLKRARALVPEPSIARLDRGFLLLFLSQVAAISLSALTWRTGGTVERTGFDLLDVAFWAHYGLIIAGLVLVFASFGRRPFKWTPALAPILLVAGPTLQFATIILLFFVVLHSGLNHIARTGRGSGTVASGFFLIFTGHVLNLIGYTPLGPRWWLGEAFNVLGFLILWWSVARPKPMNHA